MNAKADEAAEGAYRFFRYLLDKWPERKQPATPKQIAARKKK